jgi:hypothetical protein
MVVVASVEVLVTTIVFAERLDVDALANVLCPVTVSAVIVVVARVEVPVAVRSDVVALVEAKLVIVPVVAVSVLKIAVVAERNVVKKLLVDVAEEKVAVRPFKKEAKRLVLVLLVVEALSA